VAFSWIVCASLLSYSCTIKPRRWHADLYFGFVDLERAFDRVLREVIRLAMYKLGVEEWLVSAVMSMYAGAVVRTVYGNSNCFEVKVGMHQGSVLSPLLFVIVMEATLDNSELPYHGSCCMWMT